MIILNENKKCPYGHRCPNTIDEGSENGLCQGLNPARNTSFRCELVGENGNIEILNYLCGDVKKNKAHKKKFAVSCRAAGI